MFFFLSHPVYIALLNFTIWKLHNELFFAINYIEK